MSGARKWVRVQFRDGHLTTQSNCPVTDAIALLELGKSSLISQASRGPVVDVPPDQAESLSGNDVAEGARETSTPLNLARRVA